MQARTAVRAVCSDGRSSYIPQMSADQGRSSGRSAGGTPRSSAITATGRGSASVAIRSNSPAPTTSSTSPSIIRWIRSRMPSTMRGVNAFETSDRTRV